MDVNLDKSAVNKDALKDTSKRRKAKVEVKSKFEERYGFSSNIVLLGFQNVGLLARIPKQRLYGIGSIWNRTQLSTLRLCLYTGPAGTVPIGTASRTQMGPLTESIPFGTVTRKVLCKWVERFQNGNGWEMMLLFIV